MGSFLSLGEYYWIKRNFCREMDGDDLILYLPQSKLTPYLPFIFFACPGPRRQRKQLVVLQKGTNLAGRTQKIILTHCVWAFFRNCWSQNDSHLSRPGKAWMPRPPLRPNFS